MAIFPNQHTSALNWFRPKKNLKIRPKDQAYFLITLGQLLDEGFSFNRSLEFLGILLPKYQEALALIQGSFLTGESLDRALVDLGFKVTSRSQIYFSAKQGYFAQGLSQAGHHLQLLADYKKKLLKQMVYPVFLALFLGGLMLGMRSFLLPTITTFISQDMYDHNFLVRLLITFFTYLPHILVIGLAISLILFSLAYFYLLKQAVIRQYYLLGRLPIIGKWFISYASYKFTRELGHFYASGQSLQETMVFLITYPIDPLMTGVAQALDEGFRQGHSMHSQLQGLHIFRDDLTYVIHQAEMVSQLASQCQLYSDKLWKDLISDINQKISFIQPILFIFIALLIMAMYLMMMLPMLAFDGLGL